MKISERHLQEEESFLTRLEERKGKTLARSVLTPGEKRAAVRLLTRGVITYIEASNMTKRIFYHFPFNPETRRPFPTRQGNQE